MKRKFDFGCIDYMGSGVKQNRVTIDMEYEKIGNKKRFSVCADVWNARRTDIVAGGQCLDSIAPYINDPVYSEIFRLWSLYHLNDMHPECEHQAALGWIEKASKIVTLYHWKLTSETFRKRNAIKDIALKALKAGKTFTPSKEQSSIVSLSLSLTTHAPTLDETISVFYEPKKSLYAGDIGHTETKTLGWLNENEHPDGLLSRACPVCGYKYGTAWLYRPIPADDEAIILKLLNDGHL